MLSAQPTYQRLSLNTHAYWFAFGAAGLIVVKPRSTARVAGRAPPADPLPPLPPPRPAPSEPARLDGDAAARAAAFASDPSSPSAALLLYDWFGGVSSDLLAGLDRTYPGDFKWVGDPRSILVNGRGAAQGACLPAAAAACGVAVVRVAPGQPVLLRLANAASLSFLSVALGGGARWTVVQVPQSVSRRDLSCVLWGSY